MQITRQQIIDYLRKYRLGTSIQMGHALQVTTANIRHHLHILLEQGFVEIIDQEPGRGRGRPTYIYSLTPAAQEDNLAGLAAALLDTLLSESMPEGQAQRIVRLADKLLGSTDVSTEGLRQRLDQTISRLNELHYQSRWEASAKGPRVILGQCPYTTIIARHPELCQMDAAVISKFVDLPVKQIAKLERSLKGVPHCVFIVR
jgi:predicted ArsR family transcriptional regulator